METLLRLSHFILVSECGDPGVPTNGTREGDVFNVGSTVTFECEKGFDLEGISSVICGVDGRWSTQAPTCSGKNSCFLFAQIFKNRTKLDSDCFSF